MAEAQTSSALASVSLEGSDLASLLQKEFKPKTDRARAEVETAVRTLAEQALRDTAVVSDDVIGTIKAIIAEIDHKLSEQINLILHHTDFQKLESAWRGLRRSLVRSECTISTQKRERTGSRFPKVPLVRIELTPPAPEAGALSAELQGRLRR